ncbi:MAG: PEP-CTERM-box response regulator transcription factor [Chthoniobacterales bacterium]
MRSTLLLVDDDEEIRTQMKWALMGDYDVVFAGTRQEAVEAYKSSRPAAILLDLGLPPHPNSIEEGIGTLGDILSVDRGAKVIVISGQGEKKNALEAVGAGAYDFLCKPIEMAELQLLLRRCIYVAELETEYRKLQQSARPNIFEEMIGTSPQMQGVFSFIKKVAATTAPVLLLGESGTGKEMAALAIHRRSQRKDGPFIAINCNAIPENLLESELFGHEKGSFTGAHMQRKGLIETADGGSLFLDEIGELPSQIQVKLLRYLQEQRFQRVGGRQEIQSDARVIAATNVDLKQAIAEGKFREDLFFRLAVVVIKLPALRERGEDTMMLAREFLQRYAVQNSRTNLTFTTEALRAMNGHHWPGNVRELQNRVKRAVIMADSKRITESDLELVDASDGPAPVTLKEARESVEKELVQQTLQKHLGRISSAAIELGISRPTLYELMEKLGIPKKMSAAHGGESEAAN